MDCPETFNDDNNVDELETIKLLKLVLLFKLFIDNIVDVENVDKPNNKGISLKKTEYKVLFYSFNVQF